jgi:3-phenylpropionate/trans-cinnamate dioxygenase ferredoxin reductase subunit
MERCKFLIIGGGVAADAAARGIYQSGEGAAVIVVSAESDPPYDRPALSKALWKGAAIDTIWRHTESTGAELRLGTRIVALDRNQRTATSANGDVFAYEKLLLATGGSPRRRGDFDPSVIYFRSLADFRRAWELASRDGEFAVVGGGFIGSEIAAALAMNGHKVSLIFPGACIGDHIFPRPLANFLNIYFRKHGVDVRFDERVLGVDRRADKLIVRTSRDGSGLSVDAVIAGIGSEPNVELAKAAGLPVDGGIVVDEMLRTADPDIYAAGDAANFPCAALGRRLLFDHADNAQAMGMTAGHNMAGRSQAYRHLPYFYSQLFDLGYEAVGEIDSGLRVVEDWEQKFHKGVIYYLAHERVRGVLLWNTRGLVDAAREVIASGRQRQATDLVGRLRESGTAVATMSRAHAPPPPLTLPRVRRREGGGHRLR